MHVSHDGRRMVGVRKNRFAVVTESEFDLAVIGGACIVRSGLQARKGVREAAYLEPYGVSRA